MFGNNYLEDFQNASNELEEAQRFWTQAIITMDPFARKLTISQYESFIWVLDEELNNYKRQNEPGFGIPLKLPPDLQKKENCRKALNNALTAIYEVINDEDSEGENYLYQLPIPSDLKSLYEKRLEQIREDSPGILNDQDVEEEENEDEDLEEEEENPINSWDEFYSEFENKFTDDSILLIEFDDTEEVRSHLESLGYITTNSSNLDVSRVGEYFPALVVDTELVILIFHKCPLDFNLRRKKSFVKEWFELNTKLVTNIDNRLLRYSLDIEYKLQEDLDSFMESLENDLQSIAKKEEGKESVQDPKPISDEAFSDSINEFLMANAAVIISANFWALHEIKSHTNPETWEEDPDHLESVISNYKLFSNKDDLLEWIKERIDLYEGMGYLDKFLKIGNSEECDYPDAESFLESLDCDYVIGVLKICWAKACTTKEK